MSRLTRDGTAEPVSRDQILRRARGQGNIIFSVQLTTSRIGNLIRFIHSLLYVMTIHTYIHNDIYYRIHRSLFCTFPSVARKVEKYRYFATYVTLILVPRGTVVKLSPQVVDWVTSDASS